VQNHEPKINKSSLDAAQRNPGIRRRDLYPRISFHCIRATLAERLTPNWADEPKVGYIAINRCGELDMAVPQKISKLTPQVR
jgi:hypothetical protein